MQSIAQLPGGIVPLTQPVSTHFFVWMERLDIPTPLWEHSQWRAGEKWCIQIQKWLNLKEPYRPCQTESLSKDEPHQEAVGHPVYITTKALKAEAEIHVQNDIKVEKVHQKVAKKDILSSFTNDILILLSQISDFLKSFWNGITFEDEVGCIREIYHLVWLIEIQMALVF